MCIKRRFIFVFIVSILIFLFSMVDIYSIDLTFKDIEIKDVSRYNEDRIAFQHIQLDEFEKSDDSIANLLIIKNKQIYLLRDGYDDAKFVKMQQYINELRRNVLVSLWKNKINSKPDYIKITERRLERMRNLTEDYVDKNFGDFYRNVRNSFISKHVEIFKGLIIDRGESALYVNRTPIPSTLFVGSDEKPAQYCTRISAKTIDGKIYYAEDVDGDEITETFYVHLSDGFDWGYKSGPNIIFIYKNDNEDIKQMIGKLAYYAYFGLPEEEKIILDQFPSDSEILNNFGLEKITLDVKRSVGGSTEGGEGAK